MTLSAREYTYILSHQDYAKETLFNSKVIYPLGALYFGSYLDYNIGNGEMNGCVCSKIMCIGVQFGIMAHQVLIYLEDKYSRDICISPHVIGFSVFTNFVIALDCVPTITSENVYYFPYTLSASTFTTLGWFYLSKISQK